MKETSLSLLRKKRKIQISIREKKEMFWKGDFCVSFWKFRLFMKIMIYSLIILKRNKYIYQDKLFNSSFLDSILGSFGKGTIN